MAAGKWRGPERHEVEAIHDLPGIPTLDSPEYDVLLDDLVWSAAPRRFALCAVNADPPDAALLSYGLQFEDRAVLVGWTGRPGVLFGSAEIARRTLPGDARLVWLDEPNPYEIP